MTTALLWLGEIIGATFLAWFLLAIAHQYRLDHPRCPRCRRRQLSALEGRLHAIDCPLPAADSQPTRRSPAARAASAPLAHRGGTGTWH